MTKKRVLIVDDEDNVRHMLQVLLKKEGYGVDTSASASSALDKLAKESYDFVLCDVRMPQMDGLTFLKKVKKVYPDQAVLIMTAYGNVDTAIEAMKLGAYDYLSKPFKPDEILLTLKKAEERQRLEQENILLKDEIKKEYSFANIIAKSPKMLAIFDTIRKIADYKTTSLILGESGTGKELVARALHFNSSRADRPFITVNCGAIPENLLESELFGHAKGSFTGAHRAKKGLFEEADKGTLFLDEIGELPLLLQVKLLRVLQEEEIRRVGDNVSIKVDVRIIAATVKDLTKAVEQGDFREDLFYRLNVLPIYIPPLRERKEDIPILVDYFIDKYNKKLNLAIKGVTNEAMKLLMEADWPGNVREIENTIERAIVLSSSSKIGVENLPTSLRGFGLKSKTKVSKDELSIKKMTRVLEEDLILKALEKAKGNKTVAAKLLEISHRALLYKIKEYRLNTRMEPDE